MARSGGVEPPLTSQPGLGLANRRIASLPRPHVAIFTPLLLSAHERYMQTSSSHGAKGGSR